MFCKFRDRLTLNSESEVYTSTKFTPFFLIVEQYILEVNNNIIWNNITGTEKAYYCVHTVVTVTESTIILATVFHNIQSQTQHVISS